MHALEVIIARNARAAGREAGHADNDGDEARGDRIVQAVRAEASEPEWTAFVAGYLAGRKEG